MMQATQYKNPVPTVDTIIYDEREGIVLIKRKNPPYGWALPGGFVDYGETVEAAAIREALEETSLHVELQSLLGVYSDPQRDPRLHTISVVFIAKAKQLDLLAAADDASQAQFFTLDSLPELLAFDHAKIVQDFIHWLATATNKTGKYL